MIFQWRYGLKRSVAKPQQEILHAPGSDASDDELEIFLKNSNVVFVKVRNQTSDELTSNITINWLAIGHHLVITRSAQNICLLSIGAGTRIVVMRRSLEYSGHVIASAVWLSGKQQVQFWR